MTGIALAVAIIIYGFLASALPVWLLLAPRDYLSTFVKLGVVLLLAIGILFVRPDLQLPPLTQIHRRNRPDLRRKGLSRSASSRSPAARSPVPCPDLVGHDAEDDRSGMARVADRIWVDVAGELCRDHGADCRLRAAARRILCGEFAGRRGGRYAGSSGCDDQRWGYPVSVAEMQSLAADVGEKISVLPHRWSALARPWHGAYLCVERRRASRSLASGITSRSCSRRCLFSRSSMRERASGDSCCRICWVMSINRWDGRVGCRA